MVIGESPGKNEVRKGEPFVGLSGQLLKSTLRQLGQDPDQVYYTNSIMCHAPAKPEKDSIVSCNGRLKEELEMVQPEKLLLVGSAALQAIMSPAHGQMITRERGRIFMTKVGDRLVPTMATYHPSAVLRQPDGFRDFAQDIERLLTSEGPYPLVKPDVYVAWKPDQARRWLADLQNASIVSCDIETTGLSICDSAMLSVGFGVLYADKPGGASFIFPKFLLKHDDIKDQLEQLIFHNPNVIVFHNGKFDLKFLRKDIAWLFPQHFADTMLMHYVLDERPGGHSLKDLARTHYDIEDYHFDFKEFYDRPDKTRKDWEEFFYYQGRDCYYTRLLYDDFEEELDRLEEKDSTYKGHALLNDVLYPGCLALTAVEEDGVQIDTEYLRGWAKELAISVDKIQKEVSTLVESSTQGQIKNFNPASAQQVARLLYNIWKYPQIKSSRPGEHDRESPTGRNVINRFKEMETDPVRLRILNLILAYRHDKKFLGTYAEGLLKSADSDGRIRPSFWLHGTVTGRLSCSNPNLQNIPSPGGGFGSEVQRAFVAQAGSSLVDVDYSQLELRVVAHFSNDPAMIQIYKDDKDIHEEVRKVLGIERKWAKMFVFGLVYGRSPAAMTKGREMQMIVDAGGERWSEAKAAAFQDKFLSAYPGLKAWLKARHEQAVTQHYVENPLGRRRRFPFITNSNRAEVKRQGANTPIQGTASDICLTALTRLQRRLPEGANIRITVHDSLVLEIRNDILEEVLTMVKEEMTVNLPFPSDVPFKVDMKVGKRWGELTKLTQILEEYSSISEYLAQRDSVAVPV